MAWNFPLEVGKTVFLYFCSGFCTCPKFIICLTDQWVSVSNIRSRIKKGLPFSISNGLSLLLTLGEPLILMSAIASNLTQFSEVFDGALPMHFSRSDLPVLPSQRTEVFKQSEDNILCLELQTA